MSAAPPPDSENGPGRRAFGLGGSMRFLPLLLMLVLGILLYWQWAPTTPEITYSQFKTLLADGSVTEVSFRGATLTVTLKETREVEPGKSGLLFLTTVPPVENESLLRSLEESGAIISAESAEPSALAGLLYALLPLGLLLGLLLWMQSRAQRRMSNDMGIDKAFKKYMKGNAKPYQEDLLTKVTFADVAGCEQAKQEVTEIVDFLKDPQRYREIGAEIPRGILLDGPPGTGKTLLARAVAGEAEVPFFSISASEFIEMFVGVGAARVRSLFEDAKKAAPAIIFIDEVDSIGRVRGTGLGGGHDEREQTLNQILSEMDGFERHDAVIVVAATNRPDVLDPALLRPGRFDRHVTLDLPDLLARKKILEVHVAKIRVDDDLDLMPVARATPGFSGADLKNLVNEAALHAVRDEEEEVSGDDFDAARDKIIFGTERALIISEEEKHRLAAHEAGHTIVGWHQTEGDPVQKVTIIPRGRALGATYQLPEMDRYTYTERYIRGRLEVLLGGRAAEQELTGEVSSGAEDDIRKATDLARRMVSQWGMDDGLGPIDLSQSEHHPFLGKEMAQPRRFSETTAHELDQAVRKVLEDAGAAASRTIRKHREAMAALVDALQERESLSFNDLELLLGPTPHKRRPPPKAGKKSGERKQPLDEAAGVAAHTLSQPAKA